MNKGKTTAILSFWSVRLRKGKNEGCSMSVASNNLISVCRLKENCWRSAKKREFRSICLHLIGSSCYKTWKSFQSCSNYNTKIFIAITWIVAVSRCLISYGICKLYCYWYQTIGANCVVSVDCDMIYEDSIWAFVFTQTQVPPDIELQNFGFLPVSLRQFL